MDLMSRDALAIIGMILLAAFLAIVTSKWLVARISGS